MKNHFDRPARRWAETTIKHVGTVLLVLLAGAALNLWQTWQINLAARAAADDFGQKLFRSIAAYTEQCAPPRYDGQEGPI